MNQSCDSRSVRNERVDPARALWCGLVPQVVLVFGLWGMYAWVLAPWLTQGTVEVAQGKGELEDIAGFFSELARPVVVGSSAGLLLVAGVGLAILAPSQRRSAIILALGAIPTLALAAWCWALGVILPRGVACEPYPLELSAWTYLPILVWLIAAIVTIGIRIWHAADSTFAFDPEGFAVDAQLLALVILIGAPSAKWTMRELGMAFPEIGNLLFGVWQAILAVALCKGVQFLLRHPANPTRAAAAPWLAFLISCGSVLTASVHLASWTRPFGDR